MATVADGAAPPAPAYSPSYRTAVLWLLVAAYTFNFIDRTIISTIGQAIKEDLKLTDQQLGWLGGLSFALLYTTLGIPIARLAERRSRVNIIAISIVIWSGFTALCGTATSFLQLLLYRVGVGVGEAGLSPPAHSLISDYFEPRKRASALSIYAFGIPLGTMFGAVAGGWIAQNVSWQAAFMLVGLPGIAVAIAIKLFVKEPPRGWADRQLAGETAAPAAAAEPTPSILAVARRLFGSWGMFHMAAGVTMASFAGYGAGAYVPPYLIRQFGMDLATTGLVVGLVAGVANAAGTLAGGFLTDWAGKRSARWSALIPAIGLLLATPLYLYAFSRDAWQVGVAFWLVAGVLHYTYIGPSFGVVQNAMDVRMRATAVAVLFFVLNLIALGFGPPFTGWLIDTFAQLSWAGAGGAGAFTKACPGGIGAEGGPVALDAACRAAMAAGTRSGVLGTSLIYAWAGVHYLLAAITLPRDIAAARASV
ncbi:major facilitator family transporter [Phenylobacterium zucineum HLK1]|uniref:Major facilitator family transporter n=1 Tax=Phenylobacterium zucineum (strain HLK1) TaxID=450851 RepID=B4RGL6_PHEZH|nr:MFS transporter [Phenylobacterium zucineum]ACG78922.1 major facilitator family transporter [Phenylobacterium zucineum HLK1]